MTELERILYRELYKKSFYEFVKAFWSEADPAKFIDGKLIKFYCEIFQYKCKKWIPCEDKKIKLPKKTDDIEIIDIRTDKNKININVPPRHTKSMIFNVFGPTWLWISNPILAVSISHNAYLSRKMNSKRHKIINSEKFKFFFNDIQLISNSTSYLKDNRGGELYSISRNSLLGNGADLIINDDLTNAETARKDKEEMNNAWSYYQNTMPSRINNPELSIIFNIQQRLAPNDITGHILNDSKLSSLYDFIVLPAIFDKDTYVVCPISGEVISWKKGETLWPERFGDYEELKCQVGEVMFETEYLQKPIASDRTIIKENMLCLKDMNDTPGIENAEMIYSSHDFPVKDKDSSDFLGSVLAYKVNSTLYLVDCLEKRMAFNKSVEYVRQLDNVYPGIIQVIEDKANGSPILQQLQDEVAGMQAFNPGTASKSQRLESASLYIISKNVIFVKTQFNKLTNSYELSEAMKNLITRLLQFPFVEHDDIVDACDMLILFVFMDKKYSVYGRSFNKENMINNNEIYMNCDYSNIFFNKEGDIWKALDIGIKYGEESKLIIKKEIRFKADIEEALNILKDFGKDKAVLIDCSATDALQGMFNKYQTIEKYNVDDFDKSVAQLNLAFSKKRILLSNNCKLTSSDIISFKFNKSKDESAKYLTTKDGFVSCIRIAMHYYGGII